MAYSDDLFKSFVRLAKSQRIKSIEKFRDLAVSQMTHGYVFLYRDEEKYRYEVEQVKQLVNDMVESHLQELKAMGWC